VLKCRVSTARTTEEVTAGDRWARIALPFALAIALVAARLPVLLTSDDVRRGAEERLVGVLPVHLIDGLVLPVLLYQQEAYAGGTVVTGLAAYPFFRVLGPTYFALKATALAFAVVAGLLFLLLVRRTAGERAAWIFAALYVLAPPVLQLHQVIAYGNHAELNVLIAAALLCAEAIARRGGVALPFLLGIVSGFALYFDYAFAVFAIVLGAAWLLRADGRGRTAAAFLPGLAIGLAPWFLFHGTWNVAGELGAMFVGTKYGWGKAASGGGVGTILMSAFGGGMKGPLVTGLSTAAYFATAAGVAAWGLVSLRRTQATRADAGRLGLFLLLSAYLLLYVVAEESHRLSLRDQAFRARYLGAVWPSALVVLALAIDRIARTRKAVAAIAALLLAVPCAVEGVRLTGKAAAGDLFVLSGEDTYYLFKEILGGRLGISDENVPRLRDSLHARFPDATGAVDDGLLAGIGYSFGHPQDRRTAKRCPSAEACDPAFAEAAGVGARIVRYGRPREATGCPPPVPQEACRRGMDRAHAVLGDPTARGPRP
jgi:hypothetical protein